MDYTFSIFNKYANCGVTLALDQVMPTSNLAPVILCIGSDLALGDSLGPLVGTLLSEQKLGCYIYGTLGKPITAKEIKYINHYIKQLHPNNLVIAVDAAIGQTHDIGLIKVYEKGLRPGLGAQKELGSVGDVSILGIVASKSFANYNLLNCTRLNMIYKMANIISLGISSYCLSKENYNSSAV